MKSKYQRDEDGAMGNGCEPIGNSRNDYEILKEAKVVSIMMVMREGWNGSGKWKKER